MKNYFTFKQASTRLYNLCKSIWNLHSDVREYPHYQEYVESLLRAGYKVLWVSKLTGYLYFDEPKFPIYYLQVNIILHDDKYEFDLL